MSWYSWDNITQVNTLCNVVLDAPSRQHCTRKNPVQYCLSSLWTTLHRQKPCAMLSKRLQTTLHRKNPVQCYLNTLGMTLHNSVVQETPDNIAQEKNSVQCCLNTPVAILHWKNPVVLEASDIIAEERILFYVVEIVLGQHCIGKNPVQWHLYNITLWQFLFWTS